MLAKIKKLKVWQQGLIIFGLWKIITFSLAFLATFLLPLGQKYLGREFYPQAAYFSWIWANFDGVHYLDIAQNGYRDFNFAYFPLYPWLIALAQKIFSFPALPTGIIISNLAFLGAILVIYKIVALDFKVGKVLKTLLFLIIFPVSFFYGCVYTESLYLLFATLSFYFARRSKWLLCGGLGYLAGLTRLVGVALLPALLIEWLIQNNFSFSWSKFFKTKAYFLFLIPLGIITYAVFLQLRYGDALLFQKSMIAWEQNKFVFPLQVFWRYLKIIILYPQKFDFVYWVAILEVASTLFYFFLAFYSWKKLRISYGVLMFISLIIPTFTGIFQSMPRYILHLFPAFMSLTILTEKSKIIFWGTIIVFLIMSLTFIALFTRGYFIA